MSDLLLSKAASIVTYLHPETMRVTCFSRISELGNLEITCRNPFLRVFGMNIFKTIYTMLTVGDDLFLISKVTVELF